MLEIDGTTGDFIGQFASVATGTYSAGLTFGPDGRLYHSTFAQGTIVRHDGETGEAIDVFNDNVPFATGMEFGPDGNLYVSLHRAGEIWRLDSESGDLIDVFAAHPTFLGSDFLLFTMPGQPIPEPATVSLLAIAAAAIAVRRASR